MRHFHLLVLLSLVAACGDSFGLPRASIENEVDTLTMYALTGTPVSTPSGLRLESRAVVRTDQTSTFDFAFDIDSTGQALLLNTGALRLGRASGALITQTPFDAILVAPDTRYELDSAVAIDGNTVAIIHSRPTLCGFGLTARFYAKLRVLELDTAPGPDGRKVTFEILVDTNCGYRGLEPGLPHQ
jgi:hypothetical protein